MKRLLLVLGAAAALAGCAEGYGPYGSDMAYYDDAYGPFYDGYWGGDGFFYYSTAPHGRFIRDEGRHFRRDGGGPGFHSVHGHGHFRGFRGGRPH